MLLLTPSVLLGATNSSSLEEIPPLRPPRGELVPTFWEQNGFWVMLAGALVLALTGIAAWWLTRPRPAEVMPPAEQARRSLEPLQNRAEDGQVLSQISQIVRHYFAAAFDLPAGELTTTEFCQALQTVRQVRSDLAAEVGHFLEQCDERKFAVSPPQPSLGAVKQAATLIKQAEACRTVLANSDKNGTSGGTEVRGRQDACPTKE